MTKPVTTTRLTPRILLEQTPDHIHVQFDTPYTVASSAVLGGGLAEAAHILNVKVEKQPAVRNSLVKPPEAALAAYCAKHVLFGEILADLVIKAVTSSINGNRMHALDASEG